jgi:hypothetical protein
MAKRGEDERSLHYILFGKLQHGIRKALDWFKSYFSNRFQFVQYNGVCSQKMTIQCGVPQGSILVPLLFYCILMIFVMFQLYFT